MRLWTAYEGKVVENTWAEYYVGIFVPVLFLHNYLKNLVWLETIMGLFLWIYWPQDPVDH